MQNNKSQTLKSFQTYSEVFSAISALSGAFRKHHRKSPECDLVFSQSGDKHDPLYELRVWYDGSEKQAKEISYYQEVLDKKP